MREVVAYLIVSLDGIAQDPEEFLPDYDDEMDADLAEAIATQDTVLLGRRMHDQWSSFWPASDIQPFADFINTVQKYVATSTPLTADWPNAHAIEGSVGDFVRELKARDGGDIGVHGSITLTRSLLAAGLVDDLRLLVAPCVVGRGRRLFPDDVAHSLELVRSSSTPSGSLLVHYRVAPD